MIPRSLIIDLMCVEMVEKWKEKNLTEYALENWKMLWDIVTDIRKQKSQYKFETIHFDCRDFTYYYMLLNQLNAIIRLTKLNSITVSYVGE